MGKLYSFKIAWAWVELEAAEKLTAISSSPKLLSDVFGVVFGWLSASLVIVAEGSFWTNIVSGIVPRLVSYLEGSLQAQFPGVTLTMVDISLKIPWDLQVLKTELEKAGLKDAEVFIASDLVPLFDWIEFGLGQGSSAEKFIEPFVATAGETIEKVIEAA
jgi:hypothetical protein